MESLNSKYEINVASLVATHTVKELRFMLAGRNIYPVTRYTKNMLAITFWRSEYPDATTQDAINQATLIHS